MEEPNTKLLAAVILGRRGGLVKSEAKAIAARLNGLKGGASAWKKSKDERKKPGRKAKPRPPKKPKRKVTIKEVIVAERAPS